MGALSPYELRLNKRVISEVTPRYVHSGTVYRTLAGEEARKWDEIGWEMYVLHVHGTGAVSLFTFEPCEHTTYTFPAHPHSAELSDTLARLR